MLLHRRSNRGTGAFPLSPTHFEVERQQYPFASPHFGMPKNRCATHHKIVSLYCNLSLKTENFLAPPAQIKHTKCFNLGGCGGCGRFERQNFLLSWRVGTVTCYRYSSIYELGFHKQVCTKNIPEISLAPSALEYYFQQLSQTTRKKWSKFCTRAFNALPIPDCVFFVVYNLFIETVLRNSIFSLIFFCKIN